MTFFQLKTAIYATLLTNYYGFKLARVHTKKEKKELRIQYAQTLLNKLSISINILNLDKLPSTGQFLLVSNHRSVIDPLIVEMATQDSEIFGHWVSKKELYNSIFFGTFVRNGGSVLLDRESSKMSDFFTDVKACVKEGNSIFIFPEGTRNKEDTTLGDFKEGSRIIAMKNRLPILPLYVRSNSNDVLMSALTSKTKEYTIDVEIGDIIDYKDRSLTLAQAYKKQFMIED